MSVSLSRLDGPGDAELIAAVRGGDVDAYGELFARHVDAARRLARQIAGPSDADDLVSDAFTKVLLVLQRGGGPDLAFRAYLLTAVRRLHVDRIRSGARLRPVDDLTPFDPGLPFQDTAVEGFDNAAAARAFASLPERWQMVLWHTEVEQQKPADIAPLLGMSANSVSALAYRAREGLRQAFLSQHAADPDDVDCGWTRDHLGAYVRGGLSRRDATRVEDHLESCRGCAAVYLELTEVNSGLAAILAPLLLGTAGAAYLSSGGAAGAGAGLSAAWSATRSFLGGHTALTAVGGVMLTAVASVAVYVGAHAMLASPASDTAGGLDHPLQSVSGPANPGRSGPGGTHPGRHGTASPGTHASLSVVPTSPAAGTSTAPNGPAASDTATAPDSGPTDGPTTGSTSEPTGTPSSSPTSDPTDHPITFSSTPPPHPSFGDTYELKASGGSGKTITFSIDSSTTNHACTLADTTVTFRHAGTCVINATESSSRSAVARAKPVQQVIEVPREAQSVDFSVPKGPSVGNPTFDLQLSGGGSKNPVTVTLQTSAERPACSLRKDGARLSFDHAGSCTITATQAGDDDYTAAPPVTRTFDVGRGTQSVTFTSTPPASPAFGDTYDVTATGGDSGNPVTFSVDPATTHNACTLDGATVTVHHAGTCVIAADQAGNDDYTAATTLTQSFDVARATQTVTFTSTPPASPAFGDTYDVTATGGDSGNPVTFSVDPATTHNACTLDGATVTVHHAGTCVIAADQAGNDDYTAATTLTQSFDVARATQTVTFTSTPPASPAFGDTYDVTATGGDSGNPVTFSVDPATTHNACTLDGATVTVHHAGTCVIAADQAGNDDYTAATTHTQSFDVARATQTVTFTSTPPASPAFGDTYDVTATGGDSGNPVTFSVDPATTHNACTLDGSTVTVHHAGTCVIAADQAGNDDYRDAPTQTQSVAVPRAGQSVTFTSKPPTSPAFGDTYTVAATSTSGLPVTFSVAPATTHNACSVTGSTVTFLHAGTCVIAADQAGNDDYTAAPRVTQSVTVAKGKQTVTFTSKRPRLARARRHLHRHRDEHLGAAGHLLGRPHHHPQRLLGDRVDRHVPPRRHLRHRRRPGRQRRLHRRTAGHPERDGRQGPAVDHVHLRPALPRRGRHDVRRGCHRWRLGQRRGVQLHHDDRVHGLRLDRHLPHCGLLPDRRRPGRQRRLHRRAHGDAVHGRQGSGRRPLRHRHGVDAPADRRPPLAPGRRDGPQPGGRRHRLRDREQPDQRRARDPRVQLLVPEGRRLPRDVAPGQPDRDLLRVAAVPGLVRAGHVHGGLADQPRLRPEQRQRDGGGPPVRRPGVMTWAGSGKKYP